MRQWIAERPFLQRTLHMATIALVIGTLLFLATILPRAEFRSGDGLLELLDAILALFTERAAPQPIILPPSFWDIFALSFWIFFLASLGYFIFTKDKEVVNPARIKKLVQVFIFVWICAIILPLLYIANQPTEEEETVSGEAVDLVFDDFETAQLQQRLEDVLLELPEQPSADAALIFIGILFAIILAGMLWQWWRYRRELKSFAELPVDDLRLRALQALHELRQGDAPLADVIRRCYREMVQTVHEQRGVYRERHVTPREFEERLLRVGFPELPVQRLTRLFEQVRYGHASVGESEKRQAIDSLERIVAACEQLGQRGRRSS